MKEPFFYRFIAKPLIFIYTKIALKQKIIGIEYIPKTGRIVLAGNHTNNLDSVMIAAINKRVVHFLAKDSLLKGPKKLIFKNMGIKIGAVKMASITSSQIVPFVITGSYKLFNNNLCIEFLNPIKIPKSTDLTEYNEKLMSIISEKLKEKRK